MELFKSWRRREPEKAERNAGSASPTAGSLPLLGSVAATAGVAINQGTSMAVTAVNACVMDIANSVARCRPSLYPRKSGRAGDPDEKHPVAVLFRRPNWMQTWFEFVQQMEVALKLRGNAYAVILRNSSGEPTALIPVNPDNVMVLEAVDGSVFYQVNRAGLFQLAALRHLPVSIPSEDVFHLRGVSFNMLVGINTIAVASSAIGMAMALEEQVSNFIANGARPAGVLQTSKLLTKDTAERLRSQWEALRSGIKNAGKTAILEDGVEWKQMQMTSVDAEFVAQRKLSVEEVARIWRVPLHRIGVTGELGKIKVEEADQAYVNSVIMPDLEAWEQKFEQVFGLWEEGLTVDFDERKLLRASESTRINNQRLKVMSGLATQNECRAEEGLPPIDGGDVLLTPVNLAAVGSDMSGTAADGAGRPKDGDLPDPGAG